MAILRRIYLDQFSVSISFEELLVKAERASQTPVNRVACRIMHYGYNYTLDCMPLAVSSDGKRAYLICDFFRLSNYKRLLGRKFGTWRKSEKAKIVISVAKMSTGELSGCIVLTNDLPKSLDSLFSDPVQLPSDLAKQHSY